MQNQANLGGHVLVSQGYTLSANLFDLMLSLQGMASVRGKPPAPCSLSAEPSDSRAVTPQDVPLRMFFKILRVAVSS